VSASCVVASDIRKKLFRYSQLCKEASDAGNAVIPKGFKFKMFSLGIIKKWFGNIDELCPKVWFVDTL
jgi:hypothetical protein